MEASKEEPSSKEESYHYLSPEEIVSSVFNFMVPVLFLMFYLSRFQVIIWFPLGWFWGLFKGPMDVFLNSMQALKEEPSEEKPPHYLSSEEIMSSVDNFVDPKEEPSSEEEPYNYLYPQGFVSYLFNYQDPKEEPSSSSEEEEIMSQDPKEKPSSEEELPSEEIMSYVVNFQVPKEEPSSSEVILSFVVNFLDPKEKPSSSEEPSNNHLSPAEFVSSLFNFMASGSFLMFYLSRFPLILFRHLFKDFMYGFFASAIILLIYHLENKERGKIKIISAIPTMEFPDPRLEQEPCHQSSEAEMVTSFFNVLMIGSILLFYLWWFPLDLFRGLCNFLMVGFFSLTIMMIFIFADDPKNEARWLLSNRIDKDKRKAGDHIYTWRGGYAHHGICVDGGNVIHFTRGEGQGYGTVSDPFISNLTPSHSKGNPRELCESCGDQSNKIGVISSCIECFLSRGDLYLFQYFVTPTLFLAKVRGGTCTLVPSGPVEKVLSRAKDLHGTNKFGPYHILRNNCESFSYYCKTGLPFFSGQVVSFLVATFVLACQLTLSTRSAGLAVAEGFAVYCACRYIIERRLSEQLLKAPVAPVERAPVERLRLWQLWDFGLLTPNFTHFFFYGMGQKYVRM